MPFEGEDQLFISPWMSLCIHIVLNIFKAAASDQVDLVRFHRMNGTTGRPAEEVTTNNLLMQNTVVYSLMLSASVIFSFISATSIFFLNNSGIRNELGGNYYLFFFISAAGLAVSLLLAVISSVYLRKNLLHMRSGTSPNQANVNENVPDENAGSDYLPAFLDEAERDIYEMIVDAGGSMLQRDIVGMKRYSRSKVTRSLDRLERAELVNRMRHGNINMLVARRIPDKNRSK